MSKDFDITNAVGFFDACCPKCYKRYGWHGKLADRPPCPRCGKQEEVDLSEEQQRSMDFECFCKVQTLAYEHKDVLSPSERKFVVNMYYRNVRDKQPYTAQQRASINRIYKEKVRGE